MHSLEVVVILIERRVVVQVALERSPAVDDPGHVARFLAGCETRVPARVWWWCERVWMVWWMVWMVCVWCARAIRGIGC